MFFVFETSDVISDMEVKSIDETHLLFSEFELKLLLKLPDNLSESDLDVKRAIIIQGRRQSLALGLSSYYALGLSSSDMLYKMSDKFNDDY